MHTTEENKTAELQIKDLKNQKDQKLQLDETAKMYSLLSAICGSLCLDPLNVFIIFLLIQMCAVWTGSTKDEKNKTRVWKLWQVNMLVDGIMMGMEGASLKDSRVVHIKAEHLLNSSSSGLTYYDVMIVLAVLLFISVVINISMAVFLCHKMKHAVAQNSFRNPSYEAIPGEVRGSRPAEDLSTPPREATAELQTESKTRQKDAMKAQLQKVEGERDAALKSMEELEKKISEMAAPLKEQKTETANFREELVSRLREIEREKSENNEKLQAVEGRLENRAGSTNLELLEEKGKLSEIKWRLDKKKTDMETVLLLTDKLLQKIKNVTDTMSG